MLDKRLSRKLHNINATLVLLVVLIHAQNATNRINGFTPAEWNKNVQDFISSGVCFIAVPLFFMMSGFFFFKKDMSLEEFGPLIKKRIKTLLIPYLTVSLIAILFFLTVQSFPFSEKYFNNHLDRHPLSLLKTWLLNPLPYQLWFLRNLFVLALLSPGIYWLVRKGGIYTIAVLCAGWFLINQLIFHNLLLCLVSFSTGAYLKIYRMDRLTEHGERGNKLFWLIASWAILILASMFLAIPGFDYVLLNLSIICGIITIWKLFDRTAINRFYERKTVQHLMQFTFFVYLIHEPLLTIVIKVMFIVLGLSDMVSIITYFAAPAVTVGLCLLAASVTKKHFLKAYRLVTGNR